MEKGPPVWYGKDPMTSQPVHVMFGGGGGRARGIGGGGGRARGESAAAAGARFERACVGEKIDIVFSVFCRWEEKTWWDQEEEEKIWV